MLANRLIQTGGGLLLFDSFTEAGDTVLESHEAEIGGAWGSGAENTSYTVYSATDLQRDTFPSSARTAVHPLSLPKPSCVVETKGKTGSAAAGRMFGVYGRHDGNSYSSETGYVARIQSNSGGQLVLVRRVAGSGTTLGTWAVAGFSHTTTYTIRMEIMGVGAQVDIEVFVDGTSRITYGDTDASRVVSAGKVGVFLLQSEASITEVSAKIL